jgi:hypothetical protein
MTILVAYVPRPEGQAALEKSISLAKERNEDLIVVNVTSSSRSSTFLAIKIRSKCWKTS